MISVLKDMSLCYGCEACFSSCPTAAISMVEDGKGFRKPKIDQNKCIDCHVCVKICPRQKAPSKNKVQEAYAVKFKDETIRMKSQSGGMFWALCESIIERKGVVYGCIFDLTTSKAMHIRATSLKASEKMHGSKYIQSKLDNIFLSVKKDLLDSRLVLFVGTPCQIAGLRAYLGKKYMNLVTVDLLCHCVASPLIWKDYVKQIEFFNKGFCIEAKFRNKKYGWGSHYETFLIKKGEKKVTVKEGSFAKLFNSGMICNDACFNCNFKSIDRMGDFSIGDCWGIQKVCKDFSDKKGVSLFLKNNTDFDYLLPSIFNKIVYRKVELESVMQPALFKQIFRPSKEDQFWDIYENHGIRAILKKYCSWKFRIRLFFVLRYRNEKSWNNNI